MFRLIRQRLFRVQYLYTNLIDRQRARRLLVVNWGISLLALVGLLLSIVPLVANNTEIISLQISITLGMTLILTLIVYWQIQSGRLRWARRLFVTPAHGQRTSAGGIIIPTGKCGFRRLAHCPTGGCGDAAQPKWFDIGDDGIVGRRALWSGGAWAGRHPTCVG